MKVLHVYRTYFPDPVGGLQEAIRQIALSTQNYGVQTQILTLSPQPQPLTLVRPEGLVHRSMSYASPASCDLGGLAVLKLFKKLLSESDLVHYHYPWPFADVLHLLSRPRIPAVITYHSDIVRQKSLGVFYSPLMHWMLNQMSRIIATSPAYARTSPVLSDQKYIKRVTVIPLGIVDDNIAIKNNSQELDRFSIKQKEPYFLFVGVLRYYKGLHFLVEAAKNVSAKIVIAGSGPEEAALKSKVLELGVSNVVFLGQISDSEKVTLLKNCRGVILPSHVRSEAFGMVLLEAGKYGRPMVSCEVGSGTSYANLDGETGFVVPPENPLTLAYAMNRLLYDEVLADKLGCLARKRYLQFFSGEAMGLSYSKLYNDVIEERKLRK